LKKKFNKTKIKIWYIYKDKNIFKLCFTYKNDVRVDSGLTHLIYWLVNSKPQIIASQYHGHLSWNIKQDQTSEWNQSKSNTESGVEIRYKKNKLLKINISLLQHSGSNFFLLLFSFFQFCIKVIDNLFHISYWITK